MRLGGMVMWLWSWMGFGWDLPQDQCHGSVRARPIDRVARIEELEKEMDQLMLWIMLSDQILKK